MDFFTTAWGGGGSMGLVSTFVNVQNMPLTLFFFKCSYMKYFIVL
jgi:hypothetical protein